MNLKEFRQLKERLIFIYDTLNNSRVDNSEELMDEFFTLQNQLVNSDLSAIPFEEWKGMILFFDDEHLDLSKTHANIDFSLFDDFSYDSLDLRGCNVRGIESLYEYKEEYFDPEFVTNHPEYFPDKKLPQEIRDKYYNRQIEFNDLKEYPLLVKSIHKGCFAHGTFSYELVEKIGAENAVQLYNENPEFVMKTLARNHGFLYETSDYNGDLTYEEAKDKLYSTIISALITRDFNIDSIENLPKEIKERHPEMFFEVGTDETLTKKYYSGNLTIREIRLYKNELNDKNIDIGIRLNSATRAIINIFGGVDNYLETIPYQLDWALQTYLLFNYYSIDKESSIEEIIEEAVKYEIERNGNATTINTADIYRRYISLEEIYGEDSFEYKLIRNCGFENLKKFNEENNYILDASGAGMSVLEFLSPYIENIPEVIPQSYEELTNYINDLVYVSRKYSLQPLSDKMADFFPKHFITKKDVQYVMSLIGQNNYLQTKYQLEAALNGDYKQLISLLNKNKEITSVFENKVIIFNKEEKYAWEWESFLKPIYESRGQKSILDIYAKYGPALRIITDTNDKEILYRLAEQINNSDNYESIVNEYIYNNCMKDRTFDIRTLPESFKNTYPDLFLSKDTPLELCDLFYGKFNSMFPILLTTKDLSLHPDWYQYLSDVDLSKVLKYKSITMYSTLISKDNENLYTTLYEYMPRNEANAFIFKYSRYIDYCNFFVPITNDIDSFKRSLYENIYNSIIEKRIVNYYEMPQEFKKMFPGIFLTEPVDQNSAEYFLKFKDDFYNRKVDGEYIKNNPQCVQFLKNINLEVIFPHALIYKNAYRADAFNIVALIEEKFGKEKSIEILSNYDKYLTRPYVDKVSIKKYFYPSLTVESINECVYQVILSSSLTYSEDMPDDFKKKYSMMFLPNETPKEIKDRFYSKTISLEDLELHPDWLEYFKNTNIIWGLATETTWAMELYQNEPVELANYKRLKIVSEFEKIKDPNLQKMIKEFIFRHQDNLDVDKIEVVGEMLRRLSKSNSLEMYTFREELATQLIVLDDPLKGLEKIEGVFLKNHLPVVGKAYSVFSILNPNLSSFDFTKESKISPVLKSKSPRGREIIIFSDLIRAAAGSNNKSLQNYLTTLEKGNEIYERIVNDSSLYETLTSKEKEIFLSFTNNLMTLYNNTYKGKVGNCVEFSNDPVEQTSQLKKILSSDGSTDYYLPDRAVSMFCHFAGFDTVKDLRDYMQSEVARAKKRNLEASTKPLTLEKGDFVKGINDVKFLFKILQNGSVSREYLGGSSAGSDLTPLDTDLSRIIDVAEDVKTTLGKTLANGYGPIWIVLKNDDRFTITRKTHDSIETKAEEGKLEAFATNSDGHYGIRTGFPSSAINYIMTDIKDSRIEIEIAKNGFYIPIVDTTGQVIFTPNDYEQIRSKMGGLSFYGVNTYELSSNLITNETIALANYFEENKEQTDYKRDAIIKKVKDALGMASSDYDLQTSISGDLSEGTIELIDTGSTGRDTNLPGKGDFDFMMRIDKSVLDDASKLLQLKQSILTSFGLTDEDITKVVITSNGDFRLKDIILDDVSVDIDISFTQKTDAVQYSTDEALVDRLTSIKEQHPDEYKYVVANILLAKQILKEAEVYKPNRGEVPQGGLGGVGIENWILQNGGSFEDAAKSWLKASEGKTYQEFSASYAVYDFGENHMAVKNDKYPHDNFITCNMSEAGYEKMKNALYYYFDRKYRGKELVDANTSKKEIQPG